MSERRTLRVRWPMSLPALYCRGYEDLLEAPWRVSVVGSRNASEAGRRRASRLAFELAEAGVVVFSGLATGVDRVAHEAAMRAGGRTVAVLGTPLDKCRLQNAIARDHLVVSQFAAGRRTQPRDFKLRSRLMAELTHASVIVEAGERSGSLAHAARALQMDRPVFVLRSTVEDRGLWWPKRLLARGAIPLDRTDAIVAALPSIWASAEVKGLRRRHGRWLAVGPKARSASEGRQR